MTRCIIYCRQSRTYKDDDSIDQQLKICKNFCRQKRFRIKKAHKEQNKSARNMKNMKTLENITDGLDDGDVLVVPRVDRISRHYMKGMYFLKFLKSKGVNVYSVEEDINLNDNFGEFQKRLKSAEDFSNEMSTTMKNKIFHLARKGWHFGNPSFGYESYYNNCGIRKIRQCKHEQDILSFIRHCISNGDTYAMVSKRLNKQHIRYRKKWWNEKKISYVVRQMRNKMKKLYRAN